MISRSKLFCFISCLILAISFQCQAKECCNKAYIHPEQIIPHSCGFFIDYKTNYVPVSAVHHDKKGYYIKESETQVWICPQCGCENEGGFYCKECAWPFTEEKFFQPIEE